MTDGNGNVIHRDYVMCRLCQDWQRGSVVNNIPICYSCDEREKRLKRSS